MKSSRSRTDVLWALLIVTVAGGGLVLVDFVDRWYEFTRAYENIELDELFVLVVAALVASLWYAWRRIQDVHRELQQRVAAEEEARRGAERLKAILDRAPVEIYVKDLEGRNLLASRHAVELFLPSGGTLTGKTAYDFLSKEQADLHVARDRQVISTEQVVEYQCEEAQGEDLRSYYCIKFPIRDEHGELTQIGSIVTDISEVKQRETALRESEAKLKAIVDNTPCAISLKDAKGRYILINRWYEDVIGADSVSVQGMRSHDIFPKHFADSGVAQDQVVLATGQACESEEVLELPDETRTLLTVKFPVRDSNGRLALIGGISTDISERKHTEQALQGAKDEAERANAAKSRFLAAASHDLRQPLQALGLLVEAQEQEAEAGERQTITEAMRYAVASMGDMLNALLDISQLDAGAIEPELRSFEISRFLGEMARFAAPLAEAKGLAFHMVPSSATVHSDRALLTRIAENILSNAVRYTTDGRVLLGCRRRGKHLRIEVWDSGVGIAEEHIGRIFEEYFQVGNPARDRSKGLGLGLAIVERIVRILNHKIEVRSVPGKGSLFAIEVPYGKAAESAETRIDSLVERSSIAGQRVLLVEDDALVLEWSLRLLRSWGLEVETARNGATARRCLSEGAVPPGVIIADYRLPDGTNGLEFIDQARAIIGRNTPAVITTGDTSPELSRACAEADCALLHKPIAPAKLRSLLRWLLDERRSA